MWVKKKLVFIFCGCYSNPWSNSIKREHLMGQTNQEFWSTLDSFAALLLSLHFHIKTCLIQSSYILISLCKKHKYIFSKMDRKNQYCYSAWTGGCCSSGEEGWSSFVALFLLKKENDHLIKRRGGNSSPCSLMIMIISTEWIISLPLQLCDVKRNSSKPNKDVCYF